MCIGLHSSAGGWFPKDLTPLTEQHQAPQHAPVPVIKEGIPVIDGKLDEAAWEAAPASTMEKNKGKEPNFKTEVKAIWTLDGITFGFKCEEPDPDQLYVPLTSADDPTLWHNDNVELFLDVTGKNEGQYYQFIISPRPDGSFLSVKCRSTH